MKKTDIKNRYTVIVTGIFLFLLALTTWFSPSRAYSMSERRSLAQMPSLSGDNIISGRFMSDFDTYSMDQFPLRDSFRTVKAFSLKHIFLQKDNHGLYTANGYFSKLEYPLNDSKISYSVNKINSIEDKYLNETSCSVFLSVIPDKNYFLAEQNGYPALDYDALFEKVLNEVHYDNYIDITGLMSLNDFYYTDQHWKQECIRDIAEVMVSSMNDGHVPSDHEYTVYETEHPFYGAYVGQSALPAAPDTIRYLSNDILDDCIVTSYNTGKAVQIPMYDISKASGRDPYELFLGGSDPLITIENPHSDSEKELIVFRDSFGSSLIPLMAPYYSKITVVDLRYIRSDLIDSYVSFDDQDILFLYSTLILNNSISM